MADRARVTQEHRVAAFRALGYTRKGDLVHAAPWLENGEEEIANKDMIDVAQAIADAEARGFARGQRAPRQKALFDSEGGTDG